MKKYTMIDLRMARREFMERVSDSDEVILATECFLWWLELREKVKEKK